MPQLNDYDVVEDFLAFIKSKDGKPCLVISTCSCIKYDENHTLAQILASILSRISAVENNMTWNGPSSAQNNNNQG